MNRKKGITILILSGLVVAAIFGAIVYRSAQAAPPNSMQVQESIVLHKEPGFGRGISDEDLAEALGISEEELAAAYDEAKSSALDQAVADGLLTQAQADELESSGRAFPFGPRWGGFLAENGIDFDTFLAEALGISIEELEEAYSTAFMACIDEAVAAGYLTEERAELLKGGYSLLNSQNFRTAMQSAFEDAVNAAVAEGVITQSQADQILENNTGLRYLLGPHDFGGKRGRGFGGRAPFGMPGEMDEPIEPEGDGL